MFKYLLSLILVLALVLIVNLSGVLADERDEEIAALKTQVQELLKRVEKLEAGQARVKEETAKKVQEEVDKMKAQVGVSRVDLANALSKLKLKGRAALGFFDSGKAGSYPAGSFEMPDAKIQFAFEPDKINTIVMRFSLNNATAQSPLLDYFYLQSKDFLPFLKDTPFSLSGRLGRFKLGFGEETWSDNPVESVLPSKSAAGASVIDEGLEFAGKIDLAKLGLEPLKPLGWVVSVSDGNEGVGSDTSSAKALMGKLYYTPIVPLYLSTTYYDSGSLKRSNAEISVAGLKSPPSVSPTTALINWQRRIWEVDVRYDFKKGKKPLDPPAFSDSKGILRLSYGRFHDDVTSSGTATERAGNFGFAEGTYNLTKKFYIAGRYGFVDLSGDTTATLNSVTANKYDRYSLGVGYRWSDNTILKLGYDWNKSSGPGVDDADDNLLSAIVASQF